jgi:hypothetical protein
VLSIDLGDGTRSYAMMLNAPYLAFYDGLDPIDSPVPAARDVVARPVLFINIVNHYFDRPAGWRTIGSAPEAADALPRPPMFMQERGNPQNCTLIVNDDWGNPVRVTQQECVGLERAGVGWYLEDVERRLRNHYAGVPDPDVEESWVQISHSLVRVFTADEAAAAIRDWRLPESARARGPEAGFYEVELVPSHAAAYGTGRDDLVVLEVDEARLASRPGPWVRWNPRNDIVRRYKLLPPGDGRYRFDPPWSPKYP